MKVNILSFFGISNVPRKDFLPFFEPTHIPNLQLPLKGPHLLPIPRASIIIFGVILKLRRFCRAVVRKTWYWVLFNGGC
jgi:hypothetical protein